MSAAERLATVIHSAICPRLGRPCSGAHALPDAQAILAADPDLAQDIEDGAALRRLREALPEGWDLTVRTFASRWGVELWDPAYPTGRDDPPQPRYLEIEPSLAAAADACRVALEASRA